METNRNNLCLLPYNFRSHSPNVINIPGSESKQAALGSLHPDTFVEFKLIKASVLCTITIEKLSRAHANNIKNIEIYVSADSRYWTHVFKTDLSQEADTETYNLELRRSNFYLLSRYIKLVAHPSWGPNFNFKIWNIVFNGFNTDKIPRETLNRYDKFKELKASQVCLDFMRNNYGADSSALLSMTKSIINNNNCQCGSKEALEEIFSIQKRIFTWSKTADFVAIEKWIDKQVSGGRWKDDFLLRDGDWTEVRQLGAPWPSERGGHQLVVLGDFIYLIGGFDGKVECKDLWRFDTIKNTWTCVSKDTKKEGGPGEISCCRATEVKERIAVLGRYFDSSIKNSIQPEAHRIYFYDPKSNIWEYKICTNSPAYIYDHQISYHEKSNTIFVFGGKGQNKTVTSNCFITGLNLDVMEWAAVRSEDQLGTSPLFGVMNGHSLVTIGSNFFECDGRCCFHHKPDLGFYNDSVIIGGGIRSKKSLTNIIFYKIETDTIYKTIRIPFDFEETKHSLRIAANKEGEIIVSIFFTELKSGNLHNVARILKYSLSKDAWSEMAPMPGSEKAIPIPRTASQFVYSAPRNLFYVFGGTKLKDRAVGEKINDLHILKINKLSINAIKEKLIFTVRKYNFYYLISKNNIDKAVLFVREKLFPIRATVSSDEYDNVCIKIFQTEFKYHMNELYEEIMRYLRQEFRTEEPHLFNI